MLGGLDKFLFKDLMSMRRGEIHYNDETSYSSDEDKKRGKIHQSLNKPKYHTRESYATSKEMHGAIKKDARRKINQEITIERH